MLESRPLRHRRQRQVGLQQQFARTFDLGGDAEAPGARGRESAKERGALNKLLLLKGAGNCRGVCAMSAGNHAQGVDPTTLFLQS